MDWLLNNWEVVLTVLTMVLGAFGVTKYVKGWMLVLKELAEVIVTGAEAYLDDQKIDEEEQKAILKENKEFQEALKKLKELKK